MQILSLQYDLITNPVVNNLHFTIYRNYVVVVKIITADPDILNIYVLNIYKLLKSQIPFIV